eukprot:Gregarina_sp_Poly_1__8822@NODE_52_length_17545_cov_128_515219_g44_i0_p1_GENE_NODE_52_length_17545_cov_128_515219_g44_i0NODE_52_length_17545_cov_128_515219_g44_i0_p1_ORF_typecomplete_len2250_score361_72RNA_pol_Rpb1_5/PF04998_17/1_1e88RNA_pol_Rpb1_2/PF00623_20/5e58RNA_pol_Rpb1_2/PF00623_20/2_4e03RNA_pol_Rpb1_1/PF04997_12/1e42RNA_pol_Rpb1_3/PF04983_18/1e36RNA_pol_Rpb1_4/PF05000_17/1_7e18_NODE_52_length_17545_cov_128_515219_g44_i0540312152
MSFDANGVLCTDINKAYFTLLDAEEIQRTSVCQVYSTIAFDGDKPRTGGPHDPRMGPMDSEPRRSDPGCVTCGGKDDCPGHLGHIKLHLPVFHPLFITSLIQLLKSCCLLCRRLRLGAGEATVYLKRFQICQLGQLDLLARFDSLSVSPGSVRSGEGGSERRVELKKILLELKAREREMGQKGAKFNLNEDISQTTASIENWRRLRRQLLLAGARGQCAHCGRNFRCNVRKKDHESSICVTWDFESECPVDNHMLLKTLDDEEEKAATKDTGVSTIRDAHGLAGVDDEAVRKDHRSLGRRGKALGEVFLQAYQLVPILRDLFRSQDRPILEYLYPISRRHGHLFFFAVAIPVSANKFRPKAKATSFGGGGGKSDSSGGLLHPRTSALVDIISENARVGFALTALRYGKNAVSELDKQAGGLADAVPSNVAWRDKDRLKQTLEDHQGNYSLLHQYCRALQEKVNAYIDNTKTSARNPLPAIRQWMEKKQGAIRQKVMGKRVNFAARTTIAPDAMINTNEIGIPIPFAMKLTIAENAVPHNVDLLCRLIMNGPKTYPGCNMIQEPNGRRIDLLRRPMTQQQKKMVCMKLRNHVEEQISGGGLLNPKMCKPFIVYRHLRDGDVVVMNRQPSLHRASMMAHFIRVLTGQKTFRLNYANCGSYNADFDGDEMNLHCPQDHTARAEAAVICNSDCNYTVAKSGEPLRGLIQDHVLGGNFLTVKGTFLSRDTYFNLIYVGVAAFVDKGQRYNVGTAQLVRPEFSAGDPYARRIGNKNLVVVTEPPAIWKPEPLWTGKQVVTAVLKTLIDSMAVIQFGINDDGSPNQEFLLNYRGINLISKSKTPGDAWNGILDKDTEEQRVVIRHSELLQGVFDKAQFGASSYGLVHLCYELMGPRVAGILLSVFQRIFSTYLQLRGFSCSSGDFMMTSAGEEARTQMIERCTIAGSLLQEAFVDSVYAQMHWEEGIVNAHGVKSKYGHVGKALARLLASRNLEEGKLSKHYVEANVRQAIETARCDSKMLFSGHAKMDPPQVELKPQDIPNFWPLDPYIGDRLNAHNSPWLSESQRRLLQDTPKNQSTDAALAVKKDTCGASSFNTGELVNSWSLNRFLHTPLPTRDWRITKDVKRLFSLVKQELQNLKVLGEDNDRVQVAILDLLRLDPNLAIHFPSAAKLVGTTHLWPRNSLEPRLVASQASRLLGLTPAPPPPGRVALPTPNQHHVLPSGKVVVGDGNLRAPRLFHPSWTWQGTTDELPFESPMRYVSRLLQVKKDRQTSTCERLYCVTPSELTRLRMERLVVDYFAGREEVFLAMFDKFFQANMGKLSSRNNDLVSGSVTLYPFPTNGFASMVTTGAKGSKVNFAMICGMLSQQSLEGKRVPLMISGKTHPSFGSWDLGARAGGLITDRYLTGLRPPDYFFHCMAGREGLVDTAVKTARSGYLQRCVIKNLEGMTVSYDGSVRESDGTVIQFQYGEDGNDVCRMTYLQNLRDLVANPVITRAKFGSTYKLAHPTLSARMKQVEEAEKVHASVADEKDPFTTNYPPSLWPGSVSEQFESSAQRQLTAVFSNDPLIVKDLERAGVVSTGTGEFWKTKEGSQTTLSKLMRLKYRASLADPGEAVGCLAAQSMGEPATQMTLNTFHLAGHGAANVTLGIPRLREILQTAGDAATPVLYIPIKGDAKPEWSLNAHKVLLGFRKIKLSDVVNSVGVEANVFVQPPGRLPDGSGQPLYNAGHYDNDVRYGDGRARKFWGYEATIQFENLDHFCKVVPKYTPQKLINFTINRVVKDMMKMVNRLVAISCTKASEEVWDSEDDELGFAMERFCFERNFRGILDKKRAQKEIMKAAGLGFGGMVDKTEGDGGDMDLMTSADAAIVFKKGNRRDRNEENDKEDEADADDDAPAESEDGALPDSEASKDDSEEDLSDPEGQDAELRRDSDSETETAAVAENSDTDMDTDIAEPDLDRVSRFLEKKNAQKSVTFPSVDRWKYDQKKRIVTRQRPLERGIQADKLEDEALWSDGEGAGFRAKTLPDEAFRYMTGLKICNKTWRIVVKFGWPVAKCPRKIEFIPHFTRIIQKQVLQATPGVDNPHVVLKNDAKTCKNLGSKEKVECEIQCEGSNLEWVSQLSDLYVDHSKVSSNDIRAMFKFYGVECGRACVINELAGVFAVYGITVDFRHLSLIADAMTHSGEFRAFSRLGMSYHPSPLLQMSFETSIKFLTEGVEREAIDNLRCPAGAITVGRNTSVGTGICRPLTNISMKQRK